MLCGVRNNNDVISATGSLKFVKDVRFTDVLYCGKYCCLICRGRKLLGWPSYTKVSFVVTVSDGLCKMTDGVIGSPSIIKDWLFIF